MSYSPEVYAKIGEIFDARRKAAIFDLERRITHAVNAIPELSKIEEVLGATGTRIMDAIAKKDGGEALAEVRAENERLVEERRTLLVSRGFPADYCDPRYICPICFDTGYDEGRPCVCMKEALYSAQAELSGLGELLGKQTFENFDLKYYDDPAAAKAVLSQCAAFAEEGYKEGKNLMLAGGTGLGKTHLSTAVAERVMRKGGSVIYESAPNILADFRYEQFGRGYSDRTPVRTDKYFGADLLIVDDLGSEMPTEFTVSVIYNLINTRLTAHRSVMINTNLSPKELLERYDRRVTSRIFGEFILLRMQGEDIRLQKRRG